MLVRRTYPQPDSPNANIGPRERAMAVFKYLLDLEPEQAVRHDAFPMLVTAFQDPLHDALARAHATLIMLGVENTNARIELVRRAFEQEGRRRRGEPLDPSLVPELTSSRDVPCEVRFFGNLEPKQPEKL